MASTLLCLGFDQLCCVHGAFLTCIDSRQDSVSLEQERDTLRLKQKCLTLTAKRRWRRIKNIDWSSVNTGILNYEMYVILCKRRRFAL